MGSIGYSASLPTARQMELSSGVKLKWSRDSSKETLLLPTFNSVVSGLSPVPVISYAAIVLLLLCIPLTC